MGESFTGVGARFRTTDMESMARSLGFLIVGVSSCILAYSGVESVVQTAGLVRSWRDIKRAYLFLGLTVGIVTPVISALVLSQPGIDYAAHEGDLITHYAGLLNGPWFGAVVGGLASFTLTMAVNTAYVASAELIERVAHRYGFNWLGAHNKRGSLYRIHLMNAVLYTVVILITRGSQKILAEMYALGLVASFVINMGALLIYRYRSGTVHEPDEKEEYHKSRFGTLFLFILLLCCFIYLAYEKPYGLAMWTTFTVICLIIGIRVARKREPERAHRAQSDTPMEMILYLAEHDVSDLNIYFRRPTETTELAAGAVHISFFSPRQGVPPQLGPGYFRFALERVPLLTAIKGIIELVRYEFPNHRVTFHFGWPLSSWFDRLSIGVMVHGLIKLPREYPEFDFVMEYGKKRKDE
jgi:hypothetical protein